jgi:hypothetical protein
VAAGQAALQGSAPPLLPSARQGDWTLTGGLLEPLTMPTEIRVFALQSPQIIIGELAAEFEHRTGYRVTQLLRARDEGADSGDRRSGP